MNGRVSRRGGVYPPACENILFTTPASAEAPPSNEGG